MLFMRRQGKRQATEAGGEREAREVAGRNPSFAEGSEGLLATGRSQAENGVWVSEDADWGRPVPCLAAPGFVGRHEKFLGLYLRETGRGSCPWLFQAQPVSGPDVSMAGGGCVDGGGDARAN